LAAKAATGGKGVKWHDAFPSVVSVCCVSLKQAEIAPASGMRPSVVAAARLRKVRIPFFPDDVASVQITAEAGSQAILSP
jgi:hypothetical protein